MPYPKDSNGNIVSIDEGCWGLYLFLGSLAPIVVLGLAIIWVGKQLDTLFWRMFKT